MSLCAGQALYPYLLDGPVFALFAFSTSCLSIFNAELELMFYA